jgi:hypothetical protein
MHCGASPPINLSTMKLRKNVAVSEAGLLFNPVTGESFSVNPIGVEILKLIREDKFMDQISEAILEKYSTDKATFEKDYHDFVGILYNHNLIETNEETND